MEDIRSTLPTKSPKQASHGLTETEEAHTCEDLHQVLHVYITTVVVLLNS